MESGNGLTDQLTAMLSEYGVMIAAGMLLLIVIGVVLGMSEGSRRSKRAENVKRPTDVGGDGEGSE